MKDWVFLFLISNYIMKVKNAFIVVLLSVFCMTSCNDEKFEITPFHLDKKSYE